MANVPFVQHSFAKQGNESLDELTYERTVNRRLVHRESLAEVFLTDICDIDDDAFAAAAQLPRSHAYYGDHASRPVVHDPILLLEACRQAGLAGAHAYFGVPEDHKFILTYVRINLTSVRRTVVDLMPGRLLMLARVLKKKIRDGRVSGVDFEFTLSVDGADVGRVEIGFRFRSAESYLELRSDNRGGAPLPSSASHPLVTSGKSADPLTVGRTNPDNVVLMDAASDSQGGQALLRLPAVHPSMFDHPQDHLPGMLVVEAARQMAFYTALEVCGVSPTKAHLTDLHATFGRFGELDQETALTAVIIERHPVPPAIDAYYTQGGRLESDPGSAVDLRTERIVMGVEISQDSGPICAASLSMSRIHPW